MTSREDVCKFLAHTLRFRVCTPLEAREQLCRFDRYTFREVLRSVESLPITLPGKCHKCVTDWRFAHVVWHWFHIIRLVRLLDRLGCDLRCENLADT